MFFTHEDKARRIDFVLVYDADKSDPAKDKQRKTFEQNLTDVGVIIEHGVGRRTIAPAKHTS